MSDNDLMKRLRFHYRLKLVPRQRPAYDGEWIEVKTARPAPANFLNATKFFAPFYPPDQMVVQFERVMDAAAQEDGHE